MLRTPAINRCGCSPASLVCIVMLLVAVIVLPQNVRTSGTQPGQGHSISTIASWKQPLMKRSIDQPKDLCTMAGCKCSTSQDIAVLCNLTEPIIALHSGHFIRLSVKSLHFTLASQSSLTIQQGFFHKNRVQRMAIEGGTQFELATDAMSGNSYARLQQIDIVGTEHVVLSSRAFHNEVMVNVTDARTVIVRAEAFNGTVFRATFLRVKDLRIHDGAFAQANASSHLVVLNSRLDDLRPLQTSLREASFRQSHIGRIHRWAFHVSQLDALEFRECTIGEIEREAFAEKLYTHSVQFIDCTIQRIHKEAIAHSGIESLQFLNNRIEIIESNAIYVNTILNVTIQNNTISNVSIMWLNIGDWQYVIINHNRFGLYNRAQFSVKPKNPILCSFNDNLITMVGSDFSLYFEYGQCITKNVTFAIPCECGAAWPKNLFKNGPKDGELTEVNCAATDVIEQCYNTTHMEWTEFEEKLCRKKIRGECEEKLRKNLNVHGFAGVVLGANDFRLDIKKVAIIVGGIVVLVVLLIAFGVLCARITSSTTCHGNNVTCSEQILTRCDASVLAELEANAFRNVDRYGVNDAHAGNVPLMLMKPSKSFSVDDRVIIRQTLHDMKGKYDPQLYDQVYNNTMKVLNDSLDEPEKVAAIGEIIEALHECQKSGGDFVAFTDILFRQLVPHANAEDPVYAELMATAQLEANITEAHPPTGDHIYAEPQNLQSPLLTSEYAWPLDQSAPAYTEYAEPHRFQNTARQIISPYAIANTMPNATSSARNMPNILSAGRGNTSANAPTISNSLGRQPPPPYTLRAAQAPPLYAMPAVKGSGGARSRPTNNPMPPRLSAISQQPLGTPPANSPLNACAAAIAEEDAQNNSDHSGGSDVTYRLDDLIYADASAPTL